MWSDRAGVRPARAGARPPITRTLVALARDDVLRVLRAHAPELARRYGVRALALFGSVARDEATEASDVDLVAEFDADIITVAGYLDMLDALEHLLGARVDIVSLPKLSPRLRAYVERDLIRVA